ncbi:MAG: hypothetical protein JWM91_1227 [Rhodospirillales bacterium]|nr:hypothetical protein [Rhodospirillales bacterium]
MTAQKKCPVCGKPAEIEFRPFCSKRCADVDLGRWFNESYVVPEPIDPETVIADDGEGDETIH